MCTRLIFCVFFFSFDFLCCLSRYTRTTLAFLCRALGELFHPFLDRVLPPIIKDASVKVRSLHTLCSCFAFVCSSCAHFAVCGTGQPAVVMQEVDEDERGALNGMDTMIVDIRGVGTRAIGCGTVVLLLWLFAVLSAVVAVVWT